MTREHDPSVPGPDQLTLHATAIAVEGRGALIMGAAGQGKSTLALQLMAFGAALASDDRTVIKKDGDTLWASAPAEISGLIEARGVGLLRAEPTAQVRVHVVIDMDTVEQARLPAVHTRNIAGVALPCLHKVNSPGFPAAVLQYLRAGRRDPQ